MGRLFHARRRGFACDADCGMDVVIARCAIEPRAVITLVVDEVGGFHAVAGDNGPEGEPFHPQLHSSRMASADENGRHSVWAGTRGVQYNGPRQVIFTRGPDGHGAA